ncbi:hypothetical protein HKX48_004813 [Thoreauomyces humboldtii]|nr:hypothetical protein HKX48_004813 [Thoreauomyces humboldtii]
MLAIASLLMIAASVLSTASALTIAPAGSTIVSKTPITPMQSIRSGYHPVFTTIQAAVDSLNNTKVNNTIFIYPGTYNETVFIKRKHPLTIFGYSSDAMDYTQNTVLITGNVSALVVGSDDKSGIVRAHLDDFSAYNINIQNTFTASQAIALAASGARHGYYACQLLGYQDTVYTEDGTHFFGQSLVQGAVDYVFGSRSRAYFQKTTMSSVGPGFMTANGRTNDTTNQSAYVFNQCAIVESPDAKAGTTETLGRPWRPFATVAVMNSYISNVIAKAGWSQWVYGVNPTNTTYLEYGNWGVGADLQQRVGFSRVMRDDELASYSMASILNGTAWVDPVYM